MAEEIQITGTQSKAKIRSPLSVALLSLVTIGIYSIFWYYYINREMADLGRARGTDELGDNPGKSVLAITLGALIIVPAIISIIHTAKRIQATQRLSGVEPQMNGWLCIVMVLVGLSIVFYAYEQSELNKVWRTMAAGSASTEPVPAPA
jgi:hypothetical protein